jgi:hypothetical protein
MLDAAGIAEYLATKGRVAAAIGAPDSGFRESRRHQSEGLAHSCEIAGELWTYSTEGAAYSFTSPDGALSVVVSGDAARDACFTSAELAGWLRSRGGHDNISPFVVDNWLMRAELAGAVERAPDQRGCWRLRG